METITKITLRKLALNKNYEILKGFEDQKDSDEYLNIKAFIDFLENEEDEDLNYFLDEKFNIKENGYFDFGKGIKSKWISIFDGKVQLWTRYWKGDFSNKRIIGFYDEKNNKFVPK